MREQFVPIMQDMPGFNSFIGCWVCQDDLNLIVDVGPANTADRLVKSLRSLDLDRLDYILITHIHIDHVGALAELLEHYPTAKAICHAKGIRHLVDPSKLWTGSLKALGEIAKDYGPPRPISSERLIPHTEFHVKDLDVLETPGHAIHHLSYSYKGRLFVGEAAGTYFRVNDSEYLRPATPPRFLLDLFLKSIDRLLSLEDQPIRFAHFGGAESSHRLLKMFRDQLIRWEAIIRESVDRGGEKENIIKICIDLLIEKDTDLAAFRLMEPEVKAREKFFMANSVKGFVEFFNENAPVP